MVLRKPASGVTVYGRPLPAIAHVPFAILLCFAFTAFDWSLQPAVHEHDGGVQAVRLTSKLKHRMRGPLDTPFNFAYQALYSVTRPGPNNVTGPGPNKYGCRHPDHLYREWKYGSCAVCEDGARKERESRVPRLTQQEVEDQIEKAKAKHDNEQRRAQERRIAQLEMKLRIAELKLKIREAEKSDSDSGSDSDE